MKIIRITLKECGDSKVILFHREKRNTPQTHAAESGKLPSGKRKEELAR